MRILVATLFAIASFAAEAADMPIDLAGSEWGFAAATPPDERRVAFSSGGRLNGSGGCNGFFGTYEQAADKLVVKVAGVTLMACLDDEVMAREQAFLKSLAAVHRAEATHLVLKLFAADGSLLLKLARRDFD